MTCTLDTVKSASDLTAFHNAINHKHSIASFNMYVASLMSLRKVVSNLHKITM